MITSADATKVVFLSVALEDGSMEAFDDIKDAVAHASDLVEHGGSERAIFVAVPRARVRMAVRVDPIEPALAALESAEPARPGNDWEKTQGVVDAFNGHDQHLADGKSSNKERVPAE